MRAATVILLMAGVPAAICEWHLRHPEPAKTETGSLCADQTSRVILRMDKQKAQYSEWAYTALAAIVAVAVVKRTFGMPWIRSAYALLGSAGALLLQSLRAGQLYEQYVTGFSVRTTLTYNEFNVINRLMRWQITWLNFAALALLLFVGMFLLAVVSDRINFNQEAK